MSSNPSSLIAQRTDRTHQLGPIKPPTSVQEGEGELQAEEMGLGSVALGTNVQRSISSSGGG